MLAARVRTAVARSEAEPAIKLVQQLRDLPGAEVLIARLDQAQQALGAADRQTQERWRGRLADLRKLADQLQADKPVEKLEAEPKGQNNRSAGRPGFATGKLGRPPAPAACWRGPYRLGPRPAGIPMMDKSGLKPHANSGDYLLPGHFCAAVRRFAGCTAGRRRAGAVAGRATGAGLGR